MTLSEQKDQIHKQNMERLIKENIELKHKLEDQDEMKCENIDYNYLKLKNHLLEILEDDFKPVEDRQHLSLDRNMGWKIVDALDKLILLKKLGVK